MKIGVTRLDGVFTGAHIEPEKGMVTSVGVVEKINAKTIVTKQGSFDASQVSISIAAVPFELLGTIRYPNDRQYALSSVEDAVNRIANSMPSDALDAVQLIAQIQSARASDDNPRKDIVPPSTMFTLIERMIGN